MTDQATTYRHYLNVYGPDDLLIWSEPLPREQMDIAKRMAGVDASDPEALKLLPAHARSGDEADAAQAPTGV